VVSDHEQEDQPMAIVNIARCPEHGLHGERPECFVCGGAVEQVPMVPASEITRLKGLLRDAIDLASLYAPDGADQELDRLCAGLLADRRPDQPTT
jgi:hypothetical protein